MVLRVACRKICTYIYINRERKNYFIINLNTLLLKK